ncbi:MULTISPECIES: hypothetical protein [Cyanophyceae]|uniref:hypothetical protein n=1 Tax=Cyanophyceae TaxID=3028117 RepID=UPI001682E843|nr:hypothetical protein [Trichocoleus sp. FACHB-69]MBD1933702.1 hypothetical protein [Trichocoleus sp. FACHB-69]
MAQPTNPNTPTQTNNRQHSEPLMLWVNFILGSIFLHVLAIWILQRMTALSAFFEVSKAPIPIELITASEASLQPQADRRPLRQRQRRLRTANSSPSAPSNSTTTQQNSPLDSPSPTQNSDAAVPSSQQRQQEVARPDVSTRPIEPTPNPNVEPQQRSPFPADRPVATTPAPRSTPYPTNEQRSPVPAPQPPARTIPPPAPASTSPPAPAAPNPIPSAPPPPNPGNSLPGESSQGAGVVASFINVRSGNGGRDEPSQLAEPQRSQKQFSDLNYPATQTPREPLVLEVRLLISENGQAEVISTNVVQGSGNFAADQFVRGIIQDWKFNPAISEGQPVQSLLDVSIRVSPLSR